VIPVVIFVLILGVVAMALLAPFHPRLLQYAILAGVLGVSLLLLLAVRRQHEQLETEDRYRLGNHLFGDAQKIAHFGVWEWSFERSKLTWTPEMYQIFGVSQESYTPSYQAYLEAVHPEDRERARTVMSQSLQGSSSFSHDKRIVRPDGNIRYLKVWGHPVLDHRKRLARLIGVCHDITDSKLADARIERNLSLLEATVESTADGILVVDLSGKIVLYNQKFAQIWQIPLEIIDSRDDRQAQQAALDRLMAPEAFLKRVRELYAQPDVESFDLLEFKDGRVVERYSRPQRVAKVIVGRVWSFRDVTERVRSERSIRFLSEASSVIAESLDFQHTVSTIVKLTVPFLADGCTLDAFDPHSGKLHRMGAAHVDTERQAIQLELAKLYPLDQVSRAPEAVAMRTGAPVCIAEVTPEWIKQTSNYERQAALFQKLDTHSIIALPLRFRGRMLGAITLHSKTAGRYGTGKNELVMELARRCAIAFENALLYAEARRAIQIRDDFMSIASHELNTPLTPAKLNVQLLRRLVEDSFDQPDRQRKVAELALRTERQIDRLARLVDDMLDISRIESGRFFLNREPLDLSKLVVDVVSQLADQLSKAGCEIRLSAEAIVRGQWDQHRLEQVVINLLTNAMKYGQGQPVEVTVKATSNGAELSVTDHGIGISKSSQEHLFQRYVRVEPQWHIGGLGLGLFIVHNVVRAHGGTIRVKSQPQIGSTFTVWLPFDEAVPKSSKKIA